MTLTGKGLRELFSKKNYARFERSKADLREALRTGVWIYGAGNFGRDIALWLSRKPVRGKIMGFIDANKAGQRIDGYRVISPDELRALADRRKRPQVLIGILSPQNDTSAISSALDRYCDLHYPIAAFGLLWKKAGDNYFYLADPRNIPAYREEIRAAYKIFSDQKSRELYLSHLALRFSGDTRRLPEPEPDQYFPKGLRLAKKMGSFFDVGAYTGDTLGYVVSKKIAFGRYIAFEPDPENFKPLSKLVKRMGINFLKALPYAIGSKKCEMGLISNGGASRLATGARNKVRCIPCDQLNEEPPTYIKMDVEGFEMDVLSGALKTIEKSGPALAVCVYHKPDDIWKIPAYLKSLGYKKQYLRLHAFNGLDLVLYAFK